jgi:hypothetical protein
MHHARSSISDRPLRGPSRRHSLGRLASLALALSLAIAGCETVQFGPGEETPGNPTDTGATEAGLIFMNQRETDPGPLTFLIYRATAMDIDAVAPLHEFGPVEENGYLGAKVAAGRYKLGYRTDYGDLRAMPGATEEEGSQEVWPIVTLEKGRTYQLLIRTNDGGHTVWTTNLPVSTR